MGQKVYRFEIPIIAVEQGEMFGDGGAGNLAPIRIKEKLSFTIDVKANGFEVARYQLEQALGKLASSK